MNANILVIEDDKDIREGLALILRGDGYNVTEAASGVDGISKLDDNTDLVILDIMMPGMDGFRTCEAIREESNAPVLFLTAKSTESDKLRGLLSGGDDYMTKPFSYAELIGRVNALLRRYKVYKGKNEIQAGDDNMIEYKGICISTERNDVHVDGAEVNLSDIEYGILLLLMRKPGRTYSAQEIYEEVWQEPYFYPSSSTVMVHIRKLRVKIEKDPQEPERICTVWGKGYRFEK